MAFIKNSFLGGNWRGVRFERCRIESMTAGMQVNFSHGVFSDCCFTKVGLKAARMERCQLQYSVFTECNFDEADLTACAIVGCDMAGVRFKDSVLTHARWQNSSAQQAMFYNADLRDAGFEQCNLAAANLAMTWQDAGTRFSGCLLERACWVPRRIIQGTMRMKTESRVIQQALPDTEVIELEVAQAVSQTPPLPRTFKSGASTIAS